MSRCVSEEQGTFVLYLRSDVLLCCFCFFLFVLFGRGRARICSVSYCDEGYRMDSPGRAIPCGNSKLIVAWGSSVD